MADDELGISEDDVDELSELFHLASNFVRSSTNSFNQEQLLYLYARFKQVGNQVNSKIHIYNNVSLDHMLWYNIVLYTAYRCIGLLFTWLTCVFSLLYIWRITYQLFSLIWLQIKTIIQYFFMIFFRSGMYCMYVYIHNFHGNKLRL